MSAGTEMLILMRRISAPKSVVPPCPTFSKASSLYAISSFRQRYSYCNIVAKSYDFHMDICILSGDIR